MKGTFSWFWLLILLAPTARAQPSALHLAEEAPKHEFRGAWIATVLNLDWPPSRTASSQTQQDALVEMLDRLKAAGINAVFFQVRAEADALYASEVEPWSYWLTGAQGAAPDPVYDPLALAVAEAHRRGMELHAWFNPYRAVRGSGYANAPDHVSALHPEWLLTFGDLQILDPGQPDVRDYITRVILDVARRYDVDGVHFDDFFYPYPPNEIAFEDDSTFALHHRGFTDRGDWRRDNVNRFVAQVYDSLQAVNPALKFGISPFGIWQDGVPPGIVGLDAVNVIYADALAWLGDGTIDYLTPQLYWPFGGSQDYGTLAPWWAAQTFGRHLYVGHALYRADANTFGGSLYEDDEAPRQVRFNRADPGIQGSVFFRAQNLTVFHSKGFADTLKADLYRHPALTPPMAWKDLAAPGIPENLAVAWTGADEVTLTWDPPAASGAEAPVRRYAVYRLRAATAPDLTTPPEEARHLLAVTGETRLTDRPDQATDPYYYAVTAVSANAVESAPSNVVVVEGRAVAVERQTPSAFRLVQNYPNPFTTGTEIRFTLDRPAVVSLRVYNALGQQVAALIESAWTDLGTHAARWDGVDAGGRPVGSGSYFYVLQADARRATKGMVLIR